MIGTSHRAPAVLILAVLLLVVAICAGEQTRVAPHLEASEACCGFVQCSALTVPLIALALLAAGAYLSPATSLPVRSTVEGPLSPPPELIAFRSA